MRMAPCIDAKAKNIYVLVDLFHKETFGENLHALRLENVSLREPLSDLRAANANPQCKP